MPFVSPFFFLFSTSKPRWGFFLLVWYDSHTSPPMRCFLWKWATPHQGLTSIRNIFQLKMKEREIVFWWSKIGGEGDCWFGGCKNCKDALSPSTFYWIQTRKCVMNYEHERIHWRTKIQLSSFADINWGTASKYLIVRQWHCDGCLRDKYSALWNHLVQQEDNVIINLQHRRVSLKRLARSFWLQLPIQSLKSFFHP